MALSQAYYAQNPHGNGWLPTKGLYDLLCSVAQQYAVATATGAVFGASNTIVGHPFDTVKTKLQAQSGFGGSMSTLDACAQIVKLR